MKIYNSRLIKEIRVLKSLIGKRKFIIGINRIIMIKNG
jgi:hypothetical protein